MFKQQRMHFDKRCSHFPSGLAHLLGIGVPETVTPSLLAARVAGSKKAKAKAKSIGNHQRRDIVPSLSSRRSN